MIDWAKQQLKSRKQLRYLVSGGIGFVSEYSIFSALYYLSHALVLSNSISFLSALVITFGLHKVWSFQGNYKLEARKQLALYSGLAALNFILVNALIVVLVRHFHVIAYLAKVLVMVFIVCWNYLIINRFIFHHQDSGVNQSSATSSGS